MTNDVVASQEHGKDMDQGNRKRPAPKDVEEELTKNSSKRLRDIPNEDAAEAAGGEHVHRGQRSEDAEDLDGSLQENATDQAQRPVDNNDATISEGADVVDASVPAANAACPPAEQQKQVDEPVLAAEAAAGAAATETGAVGDASGPPAPPPQPSKQYTNVKVALINRIEAPPAQIPSPAWSGFTDHLGEGIRTRLLSLATLHLTESGAARCPDAVRKLNANSNRILLGAAPNCELYQERVLRALAQQVGARFLVADSTVMHFDDLPLYSPSKFTNADDEYAAAVSGMLGPGGGSGGLRGVGGTIYDTSDDELPPGLRGDDDPDSKPPTRKIYSSKMGQKVIDKRAMLDKKYSETMKKISEIDEMEAKRQNTNNNGKEANMDKSEKNEEEEEKMEVKEQVEEEKEKKEGDKDEKIPGGSGSDGGEKAGTTDGVPVVALDEEDASDLALIENTKSMIDSTKNIQKGYEDILKGLPTTDLECIESTKSILETTNKSLERYEALLESQKLGLAARSLDRATKKGISLERSKPKVDLDFKPVRVPGLMARRGRPFNHGGGGGGGGGRGGGGRPQDLQDAANLRDIAAKFVEEMNGRTDDKKEATSSDFKQGDRVCYSVHTRPPSPSLFSTNEDRERAAGNSLSAYLNISWLERREITKRKHAAASAVAAAQAAAAAAAKTASEAAATTAPDDGTNPPAGSFGHVLSISPDDTINIVMDYPFSGGKTFPNQPEKCGFTCTASDLSLVDDRDDAIDASFRALFNVINGELDTSTSEPEYTIQDKTSNNEKENTISTSTTNPLIIFLPNIDRMVRGNDVDTFRRLKERLNSLPSRCLFIGGYCTRSLSKEKASSGPSGLSMLFGGGGPGGRGGGGGGGSDSLGIGSGDDLPMPWYERFGGGGGEGGGSGRMARARGHLKGRAFASMFPNNVELHPPHADGAAKAWKKMLDQDIASMREKSNRAALIKALEKCDVVCEDMEAVKVTELALSKKEVEQVVGAAVASALIDSSGGSSLITSNTIATTTESVEILDAAATDACVAEDIIITEAKAEAVADAEKVTNADTTAAPATSKQTTKLSISPIHLMAAAASIQHLRAEAAPVPERSALKDLNTDQYEKQLLSEVVPPEEIAVGFNDIGALDAVKNTLHEVVILPLQRPELFTRGALTRPTKGLLLFGPPGTGKTMLAKAVASESGAHFININMSAITSKWLGEGERLVRAVFSLAHKLAPSVIFIDEIDSFLARRGGASHEHEALRKMKTEFLAGWDGLRTKQTDRVLVLAATNRPMDLDEAAIRRMPRRIFVPLPDANNREIILKTLLKDEEFDSKLDFEQLGRDTDGYSGSDLKNLCIAAAYCPLRELLEVEKKRMAAAKDSVSGANATTDEELPPVRSINMSDFTAAMKQVTPSTHADSASMSELQKWNEQYGEGGSRRAEPLVYYT